MAGDKRNEDEPTSEFSGSAEKAHDFLRQVDLYFTCKKDQFQGRYHLYCVDPCPSYKEDLEESGQANILTHSLPCSTHSLQLHPQLWTQFRTDFVNKFFLQKALSLFTLLGFILWEELVDEVSSELCPSWGCNCREWVEHGSECVNIFACQTPPGPPCMKDKVPHNTSGIVLELVLLTSEVRSTCRKKSWAFSADPENSRGGFIFISLSPAILSVSESESELEDDGSVGSSGSAVNKAD